MRKILRALRKCSDIRCRRVNGAGDLHDTSNPHRQATHGPAHRMIAHAETVSNLIDREPPLLLHQPLAYCGWLFNSHIQFSLSSFYARMTHRIIIAYKHMLVKCLYNKYRTAFGKQNIYMRTA